MTEYRANEMMEQLEDNGKVIKSVKFEDGSIVDIEMVDSLEGAVAFEVVALEDYEANGYDVDGCATNWVAE